MPSNATERKGVLQIAPPEKVFHRALVVGRDALTGGLLADALIRNAGLDAAVTSPSELLRALGRGDVALVTISADINSDVGSGFDLAASVFRKFPKTPIIILLDELSYDSVIHAFRCGARGVFEQRESMSEFAHCVEHVKNGYIWLGKAGTDFLIEALRRMPASGGVVNDDLSALTTRELQVVQHAARGKTNKAIAAELYLSEHTVKNYLFRAFEKLHVSNRVELLFYLATRGHPFGLAEIERYEPTLENEE
jgi:two-component system nitrate/nitrite response regulator NarL